MIQNGKDISNGQLIKTQVCIIGGGAAGITAALKLAQQKIDVVLLEAGKLNHTDTKSGDLEGTLLNNEHHASLSECRARQLGGTTALWIGRCLPLDLIDFEKRDYVQESGWPIKFSDLEDYYSQANEHCHAGANTYDISKALPNAPKSFIPGFSDGAFINSRIERWSLPTNFGRHYSNELVHSKYIRVLLNSFCINIESNRENKCITGIKVANSPGRHFCVEANQYIIAGGGLESTRLLLASNKSKTDAIGNEFGHLGRYYMGHLFGSIAQVQFSGDPRKTIYGFERDPDGVYCRRRFWISPQTQKKERILNTALWLTHPPAANPDHYNGILSAAHLALSIPIVRDKLAPIAIQKAFRGQVSTQSFFPHIRNILLEFPQAAFYSSQFLVKRFLPKRRIPALFVYNRLNRYDLFYHAEQTPQWNNQVTLDSQTDRFGMPRLRINFAYCQQDIESVCHAHEIFSGQLHMQNQLGSLRYKKDDVQSHILEQARDGFHQIGTTRMSDNPRDGVVDPNCKVHNIPNLYVCSSSVFPTSGQANPTLTIVALALRLADHLGSVLSSSPSPHL